MTNKQTYTNLMYELKPYDLYIHKAIDILGGVLPLDPEKIKIIADLLHIGYIYSKEISIEVSAIALTKIKEEFKHLNDIEYEYSYMDIFLFGIDEEILKNPEISKLVIL